MKTKEIKLSDKTLIDQLRNIREQVSLDIKDMSIEQLKAYFKNQKTLHPKSVWLKKS